MAQDDWFRNKAWTPEIEAGFDQRLRRARDKSQYLRIQASCLVENHPEAALRLLDRYFDLGEHFDMAQAHLDRAKALVAVGNIDGALSSYEAALERERQYPHLKTSAYLDMACLAVEARVEPMYGHALDVLNSHEDRLMFPVDRYRAYGVRALVHDHFGREAEAQADAALAMAAAGETQSGFRYHQNVGLVGVVVDEFAKRVAALAS